MIDQCESHPAAGLQCSKLIYIYTTGRSISFKASVCFVINVSSAQPSSSNADRLADRMVNCLSAHVAGSVRHTCSLHDRTFNKTRCSAPFRQSQKQTKLHHNSHKSRPGRSTQQQNAQCSSGADPAAHMVSRRTLGLCAALLAVQVRVTRRMFDHDSVQAASKHLCKCSGGKPLQQRKLVLFPRTLWQQPVNSKRIR